jgi:N-acyl-L-homoserine lactone synthetase
MMTFYFVNPDNRDQHRELMQEYFERLAKVWGDIALDDYDTQSASYVVCVHPDYGVIGGLRLLPTLGPKLSDDSLSESGVALHDDQTWEATKMFFYLPSSHPLQESPEEFDAFCTQFYAGLWAYMKEICKIEMIVTLLPESEHLDARFFGHWPFMLESTVRNPFNQDDEEYILGVLRMTEQEDDLAEAS